jgi:hypothetical protein
VGWLRRRKETLNEKLMREAGLSASFDAEAEPAALPREAPPPAVQVPGSGSWASEHAFLLRPREHDFFRPVVAHGIEGEQVSFDVLPDGTVLVDQEEGDATLAPLADAVEEEFAGLLERLDRAQVVAAAHLAVILADDLEQAFQVVNDFAPEHLEIVAADPARWLPLVENAGAVFLGDYAAVTLGDYVIGPNHTLPTSGSARFSSPLGVYSFLKRTSVASVTRGDLQGLQEAARTLARMEGLTAHANAVEVRLADE